MRTASCSPSRPLAAHTKRHSPFASTCTILHILADEKCSGGANAVTGSDEKSTGTRDPTLARYLSELGQRVRAARAKRGMARRILARDSGVSERYLAQLESGTGNPSITVLRQIADAVDYPLGELVTGIEALPLTGEAGPRQTAMSLLARAPDAAVPEILADLEARLQALSREGKAGRIALIGLRGAGKTTLGKALAAAQGVPFIELDRLVEQDYGGSIGEILALSGQAAFRRIERRCLEQLIETEDRAVIATGGGIVSEPETFDILLARCHTVWLKASPEQHMSRVIAQGDLRPMARNTEAMEDLKAILEARDQDYRRAGAILDTAAASETDSLSALQAIIGELIGTQAPEPAS